MASEYPAGFVEDRHSHRRAQLLYACTGVMSVTTVAGNFVVPPQRAVWLPGGIEHEVYFRGRASLRTLYIEPQSGARLPANCRVIEVSELLRSLILEAVHLPIEYEVQGRGGYIMALILAEIARMPEAPLYAPVPTEARLARVCREVLKDPAKEERLDELARAAGMSRRTLTRMFRRETGMSFLAWRQHVRLLEALSRLAIGQPVNTVAFDVGYQSSSAFTAMFRRAFGTTPSNYFAEGAAACPPGMTRTSS
ncbi:MAG: helix-turn-helix transcriptional regulator [Steroidobacteraceae bacterium]